MGDLSLWMLVILVIIAAIQAVNLLCTFSLLAVFSRIERGLIEESHK